MNDVPDAQVLPALLAHFRAREDAREALLELKGIRAEVVRRVFRPRARTLAELDWAIAAQTNVVEVREKEWTECLRTLCALPAGGNLRGIGGHRDGLGGEEKGITS